MSVSPPVIDCHVLAFDEALFFQALPEGRHKMGCNFRRKGVHETDEGHRRLLRSRRERLGDRSTAERGHELPSTDVDCHLTAPQWGNADWNAGYDSTLLSWGL